MMIVYKTADSPQYDANGEIRALATQLAYSAPTLQKLRTLIDEHAATVSSPSITEFREDLKRIVDEATVLAKKVSENSQKLADVSEQTAKYLTSIEEHTSSILKPHLSDSSTPTIK